MNKLSLIKPAAFAVTLALLTTGCNDRSRSTEGPDFNSGNDGGNGNNEFDETVLIANLTNNVITPEYQNFNAMASDLHDKVNNYCNAEIAFNSGSGSQEQRDEAYNDAQNAWRNTQFDWQMVEVMQLGPLVDNQNLLRDKIYSWPLTSNCAVDQDTAYFNQGEINGEPYNIENRVVTRRGLDALEYLLFNPDLNHSCSASTAPQDWDALTDAERREWRCQFAVEVANDVVNSSQELLDAWSGENGYAQSLLNAQNQPGSDFNTLHEAVNRISDALFYIDSMTKDAKLGVPLGIFSNSCGMNTCPEDLESQFALNSLNNIRSNLLSLKSLYTGDTDSQNNGVGFDDYLIAVGADTLAADMLTSINNALDDLDSYENSLNEALLNSPGKVEQTHENVRQVTDKLKSDFIHQLSLELPASSAGDND